MIGWLALGAAAGLGYGLSTSRPNGGMVTPRGTSRLRVSLARLTSIEYRNSIRDIFGVDLQAGALLGNDPEGNTGFTNDRDALTFPLFAFDNFMREAERAVDAWFGYGEEPWRKVIE